MDPAQKSASEEMESPYMNPDTNEELQEGDQDEEDEAMANGP